MPVGNDSASAFTHLEQRVTYLLERLEASSDQRGGNLGRVEDGLQDILRHLETQHANFAALTEAAAATPARRTAAWSISSSANCPTSASARSKPTASTQDSLEAVHNTLGHVVDRLAMIEGDLRNVRAAPVAPAPQPAPPQAAAPRIAMPPQPKPELPNPAAAQQHFAAAPREFHAAQAPVPAAAAMTPGAISEILEPQPHAAHRDRAGPAARSSARAGNTAAGRVASPSERIAASEDAISDIPAGAREPASTSNFIAAARRAAQAAATAPAGDKASPPRRSRTPPATAPRKPSTVTSKIRSLLVGASVVVIVLGTFKMAMTLLDSGTPAADAGDGGFQRAARPRRKSPADNGAKPATPAPSMTSPAPIGRQSLNAPAPDASDSTASVAIPQAQRRTAQPACSRCHRHHSGHAPARAGQSQARAWCRCRRPKDCRTRSADRCCARPR